jgi:hypothetical protein
VNLVLWLFVLAGLADPSVLVSSGDPLPPPIVACSTTSDPGGSESGDDESGGDDGSPVQKSLPVRPPDTHDDIWNGF